MEGRAFESRSCVLVCREEGVGRGGFSGDREEDTSSVWWIEEGFLEEVTLRRSSQRKAVDVSYEVSAAPQECDEAG